MANDTLIGIAVIAGVLLLILGLPYILPQSVYSQNTGSDILYKYAPVVYDTGQGYAQMYPDNLKIGDEFSFPDTSLQFNTPIMLNSYITVQRNS